MWFKGSYFLAEGLGIMSQLKILNREVQSSSSILIYFNYFYNLGYYALVFPFKVEENNEMEFIIQESLIQKVLCPGFHIMVRYKITNGTAL
jgi:hypothetical protein